MSAPTAHGFEPHLGLAEPRGGDVHALGRGDGPEARDSQLPADDDDGGPGRDAPEVDEADDGRGDEELVGRRVEQLANDRDQALFAGEVTVQPVGEGGEDEDGRGDEVAAVEIREHDGDEGGDGDDAGERQVVRDIHASEITIPTGPCQSDPISGRRVLSVRHPVRRRRDRPCPGPGNLSRSPWNLRVPFQTGAYGRPWRHLR